MEYKCKYCGAKVYNGRDICTHCYEKLPLAKEFVKISNKIKSKLRNTPTTVVIDGAYYCPRCKTILKFGEHLPKYCSECGQRLSWR